MSPQNNFHDLEENLRLSKPHVEPASPAFKRQLLAKITSQPSNRNVFSLVPRLTSVVGGLLLIIGIPLLFLWMQGTNDGADMAAPIVSPETAVIPDTLTIVSTTPPLNSTLTSSDNIQLTLEHELHSHSQAQLLVRLTVDDGRGRGRGLSSASTIIYQGSGTLTLSLAFNDLPTLPETDTPLVAQLLLTTMDGSEQILFTDTIPFGTLVADTPPPITNSHLLQIHLLNTGSAADGSIWLHAELSSPAPINQPVDVTIAIFESEGFNTLITQRASLSADQPVQPVTFTIPASSLSIPPDGRLLFILAAQAKINGQAVQYTQPVILRSPTAKHSNENVLWLMAANPSYDANTASLKFLIGYVLSDNYIGGEIRYRGEELALQNHIQTVQTGSGAISLPAIQIADGDTALSLAALSAPIDLYGLTADGDFVWLATNDPSGNVSGESPGITSNPDQTNATGEPNANTLPENTAVSPPGVRINSFSVTPETGTAGDILSVSWNVSGVDTVKVALNFTGQPRIYTLPTYANVGTTTFIAPDGVQTATIVLAAGENQAQQEITVSLTCSIMWFSPISEPFCPDGPSETIEVLYQPFERGYMFWRQDLGMLWIYSTDTGWVKAVPDWIFTTPSANSFVNSFDETPPEGLLTPVNLFGNAWIIRNDLSYLGWATAPEQVYPMTLQKTPWTGGTLISRFYLLQLPNGQVIEGLIDEIGQREPSGN